MRLFGLFFILGFSFSCLSGQTLQFNQVKLVASQETVPAGKVWKLNGCFYSSGLPSNVQTGASQGTIVNSDALIVVNGQNTIVRSSRSTGISSTNWEQTWPMWISAGYSLSAGSQVREISVIEFNIVP
jgi:hypothetical protein